jgi:carboxyl-terminal processing protease
MKKFLFSTKTHLAIGFVAFGFFLGIAFSAHSAQSDSFKYLDYFHSVYQTIMSDYVNPVESKSLFEGAMRGMLQSLDDPYSRFLDEKDYESFKSDVSGQFVGIGVELWIRNGDIIVISAIDDSPAKSAGIRSGDLITNIDGYSIKGKSFGDISTRMKGKPGTEVKVTVRRDGIDDPIDFTMKRAPIKSESVKYGVMKENPSVGYMRITHFFSDTSRDVNRALLDFNNKKIRKLVIDLRDNPGGDMDAAVSIADYFLDTGKMIVTTQGRAGSNIKEEYKAKNPALYTGELLLLVNGGSASSSEILSGALQDNHRAKLIGQKTFGKALVQKVIDIEEGKLGFTLTIRTYVTPNGTMIQKIGIKPDKGLETPVFELSKDEQKELTRANNDKAIEEFVNRKIDYNDQTRKEFIDLIKEKKYAISDKVAAYTLKQRIYRGKDTPLYDLEFDTELGKALEIYKGTSGN